MSKTIVKQQHTILSAEDAFSRFSKFLKAESWCIDVSTHPIKAFQATSNYTAVMENFKFEFVTWANFHKVKVALEEYNGFLNTLVDRLCSALPRVVGTSFKPIDEHVFRTQGALLANTYVPFKPESVSIVMPEVFENYLSRIFMNQEDRRIVTEWLADIIQNPQRRPQWAVVLTGAQGTGKSSILRIVSAALGYRHTWSSNQYAPAFKQFSEVLPNNLLVVFDDAKSTQDTYQTLKDAITRDSQAVEIKGKQNHVNREVYARILICSNHPRPLKIEEGDRRLYCAEPSQHKQSPEETASFFTVFNEWLEQPTTPAFLYHWLMSIDLTKFVPGSTVKTDTHANMVGMSTSVLESILRDYSEVNQVFNDSMVWQHLKEAMPGSINVDIVKSKLEQLGLEQKRRKVPGCGAGQIWLWQKKIAKRAPSLTEEQVEAIQRSLHIYDASYQSF